MKPFKILLLILFSYSISKSQNIVINGNFDTLTSCPNAQGQLTLTNPWQSARGTCDLYNTCNTGNYSVPDNICGTQTPHSGNGYAGFFAAQGAWVNETREYLHAQLRSQLIAGHIYCLTFYVSLSDRVNSWGDYDSDMAVNDLAAYFSVAGYTPDPWVFNHLPVTPQVINPSSNQLSDRDNWMQVSGSFTATGGERYITIGSFSSNANQDTTELDMWQSNKTSYYYIDDVSLVDCSAPTPLNVSVAGSNSVCYGNMISLTASGTGGSPSYQYNWNGTGFTTNSTFTTTATVNSTYTVEIKDANGSINSTSYPVTVIPLPNGTIVSDTTVCENSFITLTASGGSSYEWHDGPFGTIQTTTPSATLEIFSDMEMIVGISNGTCTDLDTINIHAIVSPAIQVSNDSSICAGQSITLHVNGSGNYLWETGSTSNTIIVQPAFTTNYSVTVSNASCSSRDSVTVTVIPIPQANAGNDVVLCQGSSTNLNAQGGSAYQWSGGQTTAAITVSPSTDTEYIVIASVGSCSDKDTVKVFVHSLPTITISNDVSICNGQTTTLNASGSGSAFLWSSVQSYTWTSAQNTSSINVNPLNTTNFIATINDGACSNKDTVKVTVLPVPTINLGSDKTICEGQTITLNATTSGSILWSNGATTSSIIVSPPANELFSATSSNGTCSASDDIQITVIPYPVADAGIDASVCEGQEAVLTGTGGGTYLWNTGETTAGIVVQSTTSAQYIVTVSNGTCSDKDTVKITVLPKEQSPCAEVVSSIEIPNIFTPNGDNINDLFSIRFIEMSSLDVSIYNRWGELLYYFDKTKPQWDGRLNNGKTANSGTYYYVLKGKGNDNKTYDLSGFIELIR